MRKFRTAIALAMCVLATAAGAQGKVPPQGGGRGQGAHAPHDSAHYQVFVYQNPDLARQLQTRWDAQVQGLENRGSRGFLDDVFGVTKNAAFGLVSTNVMGLVSTGVNMVGSLINSNKTKKEEWKRIVQRENSFEKTLFVLENLDDFYSGISTTGALDPSSMSFNGFGCLQKRGNDTVLYISCRLDTAELAMSRILRHSKFELRLDTLIFNPRLCDLPNDSTTLFSSRRPFSFAERCGLNLRIDLNVTSSWINQAIQVYNDQQLGNFSLEVPIAEHQLGHDSVFRYYAGVHTDKACEIVGDCFIVPRSYIGIRDEDGNFHDAWGTGQYKLALTIKETCSINPEFENNKELWKADWKRRKRQQAKPFDIVRVARQVWDKNANQWVVSILEVPADYATQELLQRVGVVSGTQQQAMPGAAALSGMGGQQAAGKGQGAQAAGGQQAGGKPAGGGGAVPAR